MYRMRFSENCKDATMTVRMTAEEKAQIKKQAEKEGKTTSAYVTEAAMAGLERNSSKVKKLAVQMVRNQESLNGIYAVMKEMNISETDELYVKIAELMEGEKSIWECLCK